MKIFYLMTLGIEDKEDGLLNQFYKNCENNSQRIAVSNTFDDLSYQDLNSKSSILAGYLKEKYHITPGKVVAILFESSPEMIVAVLACMKLQAIFLTIDSNIPVERINYLLSDSNAGILLHNTIDVSLFSNVPALNLNREDIWSSSLDAYDFQFAKNQDIVCLIYTSGSTGQPKGIRISQNNLKNHFIWFKEYFQFENKDVLPQKTNVSFVDSLLELLFPITYGNSCIYLRPFNEINKEANILFNWLNVIKATVVQFVPSVFDYYLKDSSIENLKSLEC